MNQTKNQHSSSHDFIDQKIYAKWIKKFDTISRHDKISIREHIDKLEVKPLISIIMPVYNTPENYLISAIESVRSQIYPNWELCIADDASTLNHVKNVLKQYASLDPKIKITYRKTNGNISAASNSALETASGDFVALMDHDDMLPSHALFMVALEINNQPDANLIYSDSDYLDTNGNRCNPYFKPDWNYDLFLGQNYITHLSVYRHSVIKKINGFRTGFEGSQDYDLALRFVESIKDATIHHIPHVLYHWRMVKSSFSRTRLAEATRIARIAIHEHLDRCNEPARVSGAPGNILFHRIRRSLPSPLPHVSLIIICDTSNNDIKRQFHRILENTDYSEIEIILTTVYSERSNGIRRYLRQISDKPVSMFFHHHADNRAYIFNKIVHHAYGDILCFLDIHLEPLRPDWLKELIAHVKRESVGLAGAKIIHDSGGINHTCVIHSINDLKSKSRDKSFHGFLSNEQGYFAHMALDRRVAFLDSGCLVINKSIFNQVGGYDEMFDSEIFLNIDLSLKISGIGLNIIWSAHSELIRIDALLSNPDSKKLFKGELEYMKNKWGERINEVFNYNQNLICNNGLYQLAFPPKNIMPWC